MLQKTHPQAVLAYTNTYDHRQVVEICARHGVPVMMEKPLAVSAEDAHAIADAARKGKIQVLVNYETSWYRSNHAAYDLVHDESDWRHSQSGRPRRSSGAEGNQCTARILGLAQRSQARMAAERSTTSAATAPT